MAEQPPILAVGAAGQFAGLIVPELVRRGARVRALIQNPGQERAVRERGADEAVVGDLSAPSSLSAALKGVERLFYIAPAFSMDEAGMGVAVVAAAAAAGVRRFVFSSVIHPILGALENHRDKGPVEEAVISSGMEYCLLHPSRFMQDYVQLWPLIQDGELPEPYSAERRMSWVDYRDVAEVAAVALTEDRLNYGTFELCAPGWPDRHEVAKVAGQALGKEVRATTPTFEDWANRIDLPGDERQRSGRKAMFDWYDAHSLLGNPLTLTAILGHEPRSLLEYFKELAVGA